MNYDPVVQAGAIFNIIWTVISFLLGFFICKFFYRGQIKEIEQKKKDAETQADIQVAKNKED